MFKNIFKIKKEDTRSNWTAEQWKSSLMKNAMTPNEKLEIQAIFARSIR